MSLMLFNFAVICIGLVTHLTFAFPEQGKWNFDLYNVSLEGGTQGQILTVPKSLYKGSEIIIHIHCSPSEKNEDILLDIKCKLYEFTCWNDFLLASDKVRMNDNLTQVINPAPAPAKCGTQIQWETSALAAEKQDGKSIEKRDAAGGGSQAPTTTTTGVPPTSLKSSQPTKHKAGKAYEVHSDGLYVLRLNIASQSSKPSNIKVEVVMVGPDGYLSAADWPLLPFYGAMCLVYVVFGLAWLAVSFCQWRDLLRVQFWIGAVILLGMLEKATFYAEYQSLNSSGQSVRAAVLLAELVSCAKRTLARMLVIIVSLGFGIVKPRLGPALHRVVLTGILYLVLAAVESYLRVQPPKDEASSRQLLLASVPLAVLDSAICWWIFSSLAQTTRTLRLRRNLVKLSLYRHFTNTLIFAVVSSLIFMLYSIRYHRLASCLTDWKALWLDDAYWHLLFSLLLLVIMILWRPGNNNQRYAFSPLLDAPEDEDEDEDDEQFVNDAFGVKMRGMNRSTSPKPPKSTNSVEEDLKWVEENIPSSMPDTALPVLDSDEEIMTTKFEVSKMQ